MSVLRVKAYHSIEAIHNGIEYSADKKKTDINQWRAIADEGKVVNGELNEFDLNLKHAFMYSTNPQKTNIGIDGDEDILVSGYMCKPDMAEEEFKTCMDLYRMNGHKERLDLVSSKRIFRAKRDKDNNPILDDVGNMIYDEKAPVYHDENGKCVYEQYMKQKEARTAYMWMLSFPPKEVCGFEIDPRLVHQIGLEFCKEALEEYPCTVSTHVNKKHIHNHIMQCAYDIDGTHKYKDNMEMLSRCRQIADDLSLKYGLPIILEANKDNEKSIGWFEWMKRHEGQSWKEQMQLDIRNIKSISKDMNDFKKILKASGYQIRETEKHFTYYMPDDEYRCRDSRLGNEFTKEELSSYFEEKINEIKPASHDIVDPNRLIFNPKKKHIYVSRYTSSGRKRSDMEIIFLVAIKFIKLFADHFSSNKTVINDNPVHKPAQWKLQQMVDSLNYVEKLGIQTPEELDILVNKTGMELSQLKKQKNEMNATTPFEKDILTKIKDAESLIEQIESMGLNSGDLHVYNYTDADIRKKKSEVVPMNAEQRRQLYIEIEKSPMYRLACKYEEISYSEANRVIEFLKGNSTIKPEIVVDMSEHDERMIKAKFDKIFETKSNDMKNKYANRHLSPAQEKRVTAILLGEDSDVDYVKLNEFADLEIDTSKLSYYDGMRIISYFTSKNNFNNPLADQMSQDKLQVILDINNASINRDIKYVTLKEVKDIEQYFASEKKAKEPDLLKESEKPSISSIAAVKQMLNLHKEKVSIPVEEMSKHDINIIYTYLLMKDKIPECLERNLKDDRKRCDTLFNSRLLDFTPDEQQVIYNARELLNELAEYGISVENLYSMKMEYAESLDAYKITQKRINELGTDYKNLSRLKYNMKLALNKTFTHGPLYDEEQIEDLDTIEVKSENDIDSEYKDEEIREEKVIEKEKEEAKERDIQSVNTFRSVDKYFESITKGMDI